jgi:hypothetical protein
MAPGEASCAYRWHGHGAFHQRLEVTAPVVASAEKKPTYLPRRS